MVSQFFLALGSIFGTGGIAYYIFSRLLKKDREELLEKYDQRVIEVYKDAKAKNARSLLRSKQIMTGKGAEQIAPHLKDFPYRPNDAQFMGAPIDYVVFEDSVLDKVTKVVFVEVKTGNSRLTKKQKSIKKAIKDGEVYFEEFRIETDPIIIDHEPDLAETGECFCDECIKVYP